MVLFLLCEVSMQKSGKAISNGFYFRPLADSAHLTYHLDDKFIDCSFRVRKVNCLAIARGEFGHDVTTVHETTVGGDAGIVPDYGLGTPRTLWSIGNPCIHIMVVEGDTGIDVDVSVGEKRSAA